MPIARRPSLITLASISVINPRNDALRATLSLINIKIRRVKAAIAGHASEDPRRTENARGETLTGKIRGNYIILAFASRRVAKRRRRRRARIYGNEAAR